jgi:hypothetical protein
MGATSRPRRLLSAAIAALCLICAATAAPAGAAGPLDLPGCRDSSLPRNDDGSSAAVDLPFAVDFYGDRYDQVYVNNNGNVTFDQPLPDYVPFALSGTDRVIIAPFFADVDTRPSDGGTVTYGQTTYEGADAFCVLWDSVGYYDQHTDRRATFELLLVRRTPTVGDFDIVFRYQTVGWELGEASHDIPAYAGFSNGDPRRSVQLAGSGEHGAFLDGGPHALASGSLGGGAPGTYEFAVRAGSAGNDPRNVPAGFARDSPWWTWPGVTTGDADGLPDNWERDGVWVGDQRVDLRALGADPARKDAFIYVDVVDGERWTDRIGQLLTDAFAASPLTISLHIIRGARTLGQGEVPRPVVAYGPDGDRLFAAITKLGFKQSGLAGRPGSVPALAKYVCMCPDYPDRTDADGKFHPGWSTLGEANGFRADHLVITVFERKIVDFLNGSLKTHFTPNDATSDQLNATTLLHELGHLYGLRHNGATDEDPRYKASNPNYRSVMSYAYSILGIPQGPDAPLTGGALLPRIDYSRDAAVNLDWRLGPQAGALSLIYGQHGERGNFYSTVSDLPTPEAPAPAEPTIDQLAADPQAAAAIQAADAAFNPQPAAPAPAPAKPTADTARPKVRVRVAVGQLRRHGHRRYAIVKVSVRASDDRTPARALRIRVRLDRARQRTGSRSMRLRVGRGRHKITITVTDQAGNRATATRAFRVGATRRR